VSDFVVSLLVSMAGGAFVALILMAKRLDQIHAILVRMLEQLPERRPTEQELGRKK